MTSRAGTPRTGISKRAYTEDDVVKAIAAISNGMSYRGAAKLFKVPGSTLRDRITGRTTMNPQMGRSTVLLPTEEKKIVDYILFRSKIGYAIPKNQIPQLVKEILDDPAVKFINIKRDNTFENNLPSLSWVNRFYKRHPELHMSDKLGHQRTRITKDGIRAWFKNIAKILAENQDIDMTALLPQKNQVFNADRTGFAPSAITEKLKTIAATEEKDPLCCTNDSMIVVEKIKDEPIDNDAEGMSPTNSIDNLNEQTAYESQEPSSSSSTTSTKKLNLTSLTNQTLLERALKAYNNYSPFTETSDKITASDREKMMMNAPFFPGLYGIKMFSLMVEEEQKKNEMEKIMVKRKLEKDMTTKGKSSENCSKKVKGNTTDYILSENNEHKGE